MLSGLKLRCVKLTSNNSYFVISSQILFDNLLEMSRRDDSSKWLSIGFHEEIGIIKTKLCTLSGALHAVFQGLQQGDGSPDNPFVFVEMRPDSVTVNSISAEVVTTSEPSSNSSANRGKTLGSFWQVISMRENISYEAIQ